MRNLGKASMKWLREAGIISRSDLENIGVVKAYLMVKALGYQPTLNFLWALQGALEDKHWTEIDGKVKETLKRQIASFID